MKAVLTIAGSDSSGGAGIQADLKTIAAHHLFGESVITALTAQNTLGVTDVLEVDPVFVGTQIDAVFDDIRPDAVKIGMVSSPAIVSAIADGLDRHKAANVVVDPVMVATSGSALIADAAVDALVRQLFPRATVITPNIPEAEVLSGTAIASSEDVEAAASLIADRCVAVWENASDFADAAPSVPAILIKGGHGVDEPDAAAQTSPPITKADLFALGLSGAPGATQRRQALLRSLALPEHLSANALLPVLNALYSYEEFASATAGCESSGHAW